MARKSMTDAELKAFYAERIANPPRVDGFEERKKIKGQRAPIGQRYTCGCGNDRWLLLTNGDCVCDSCMRAQVRIMVNAIAPIRSQASGTIEP